MSYKKPLQTILLVLFLVSFLFPIVVFAEETNGGGGVPSPAPEGDPLDYVLLAPLPEIDPHLSGDNILETYLSVAFRIFISLAIVLTVIMIIIGGVQYLSTDAVSQKGEGKNRISNALAGLMLALLSVLLLTLIGGTALTDFSIRIPGLDPPPEPPPRAPNDDPVEPSVEGCFNAMRSLPTRSEVRQYCEDEDKFVTFTLRTIGGWPAECQDIQLNELIGHAENQCAGDLIGETRMFCLRDPIGDECDPDLLEGDLFPELSGIPDHWWDEYFCDARERPYGVTDGQWNDFIALKERFFEDLGLSAYSQSAGYYFDESYSNEFGRYHAGIDISTRGAEAPVNAPVSGTVRILREDGPTHPDNDKVAIIGDDGRIWIFTHVYKTQFTDGQRIEAGQVLTSVSPTGLSNGEPVPAHLHLETHPMSRKDSVIWETNNTNNWSTAHGTAGQHHSRSFIATNTSCPFQSYWESINR